MNSQGNLGFVCGFPRAMWQTHWGFLISRKKRNFYRRKNAFVAVDSESVRETKKESEDRADR